MRRPRPLWIAGWLLARAHAASAAPSTVYAPPSACAARPVDFDAFIDALRVELGAAGMTIDAVPSPHALALSMEAMPCDAQANAVQIVVTDTTGKRLSRIVSLADVPVSTRPRTVALASAELIAAETEEGAGTEPEATTPAGAPEPATATPPPAVPAKPAQRPAPPAPVVIQPPGPPLDALEARSAPGSVHPMLGIGGEYRRYLGPATSMYGLRVVTEWPLGVQHHLVGRIDVAGALGSAPSALGTVSLQMLAGAAGAEWLTAGDDFELAIGALAEAGYAHAGGQASSVVASTPGSAATAAAGAIASMRGRIGGRFWAALEVTAGVELAGLRAHADTAIAGGVEGGYIGARFVAAYGR